VEPRSAATSLALNSYLYDCSTNSTVQERLALSGFTPRAERLRELGQVIQELEKVIDGGGGR